MVSSRWLAALTTRCTPLLVPAAFVYVAESRIWPLFAGESKLPTWFVVLSTSAALPLYIVTAFWIKELSQRFRASQLGASVAPLIPDPTLGFLTVRKLLRNLKDYPGTLQRQWVDKYGPTVRVHQFGSSVIFTLEPDHLKQVLATQFENFSLQKARMGAFDDLLGSGVFNSDGDVWKMHRNATRPYFTKDRIAHLDNFDRHAEIALDLAQVRLKEGQAIDFQDLIARFTLDSATQFLFDYDVQSLDAGLPYAQSSNIPNPTHFTNHSSNAFVNAFLQGQDATSQRIRSGKNASLLEINGNPIPPLRAIIDPYIDGITEQVMKRRSNGEKTDEDGLSLLEHLAEFMDDPAALRDEVINILVAGRDTTASLLTFTIYLLAQHPMICQKLRAEVMDHVGPSQRPTTDNIKAMKYLRAILNETLRLYSTVPFNSRQALNDTVLKSKNPNVPDIFVPAGTNVAYSTYLMHRRPDLWGPDAHLFDPDRFIDNRLSTYLTPNPFIFLPFNAGPRICLGQQFAYTEASYFMIKLLQRFESFEVAKDAMPEDSIPPASWKQKSGRQADEEIIPKVHLTMTINGGLWVRMKEDETAAESSL